MGKHTAGPWKVLQGGIAGQFVVKAGEHHDTMIGIASDIDVEANAQLIASAPELLEALEKILSMKPSHGMNPNAKTNDPPELKVGWNVHTIARNAIAKARGEV